VRVWGRAQRGQGAEPLAGLGRAQRGVGQSPTVLKVVGESYENAGAYAVNAFDVYVAAVVVYYGLYY